MHAGQWTDRSLLVFLCSQRTLGSLLQPVRRVTFQASIPFSVVGSNQLIEAKGKKVRGRLYPWGVVEVENPEHNDFLKLRTMLITHMQDLQEVTQDLHYENFRSERLKRGGRKVENEDMNKDQILLEKEAELRRMQEMIARMQAQMQMQMQGGDGDSGALGHHV
uniref:septin-2 n=1 Tax=Callospermophilus lateralis TaxID=76772 RepID=UPI004038CA1E